MKTLLLNSKIALIISAFSIAFPVLTWAQTDAASRVPIISMLLFDEYNPVLTVSNATATEGDSGTTTLTFNLKLDVFLGTTSVHYQTIDGSATTANNDYVGTSGIVTFNGDSNTKTVEVVVNGDEDIEISEIFTLQLSYLSGAVFAYGKTKAIGTIKNDDSQLNDTGITFGGDFSIGYNTTCTSNMLDPLSGDILPQDCDVGRDATHNDDSDGIAGFSFTKINAEGGSLFASASDWSCVQDNVTGLMWEKKTDDGTEQDKDNRYRWGGLTAQGRDHPNREGSYSDDWNALVNHANNISLCGYTDWRVPTIQELDSIVNLNESNPTINLFYFPNTISYLLYPTSIFYWSSSPLAISSNSARTIDFYFGNESIRNRDYATYVRLVR